MIRNELAQYSPGDLLLANLVKACCDRGLTTFDLGVGEAAYKGMFCNEPEPLFDSFLGLDPDRAPSAAAARVSYDVKRRIKRSPRLVERRARRARLAEGA